MDTVHFYYLIIIFVDDFELTIPLSSNNDLLSHVHEACWKVHDVERFIKIYQSLTFMLFQRNAVFFFYSTLEWYNLLLAGSDRGVPPSEMHNVSVALKANESLLGKPLDLNY